MSLIKNKKCIHISAKIVCKIKVVLKAANITEQAIFNAVMCQPCLHIIFQFYKTAFKRGS